MGVQTVITASARRLMIPVLGKWDVALLGLNTSPVFIPRRKRPRADLGFYQTFFGLVSQRTGPKECRCAVR